MKKNLQMANAQKKTSKYRKIERKWANIKPSKFTKKNHIINIPKKIPYLLFVCDLSCKCFVCILCNGLTLSFQWCRVQDNRLNSFRVILILKSVRFPLVLWVRARRRADAYHASTCACAGRYGGAGQ